MTALSRAVRAEFVKARASRVPWITAGSFIVGVVTITVAMAFDVPDSETLGGAKLDAFAVTDTDSLISTASQVASVAAFLAFGVMATWITGREFVDGTITGLFARPLSLTTVAAGKTVVYLLWCTAVIVLLAGLILGAIVPLGFDAPAPAAWAAIARLSGALLITALLSSVAMLTSTLSRSYLAAFATIIAVIAASQIAIILGAGAWFPFATPALWAIVGGQAVSVGALIASVATGALVCAATLVAWRTLRIASST